MEKEIFFRYLKLENTFNIRYTQSGANSHFYEIIFSKII